MERNLLFSGSARNIACIVAFIEHLICPKEFGRLKRPAHRNFSEVGSNRTPFAGADDANVSGSIVRQRTVPSVLVAAGEICLSVCGKSRLFHVAEITNKTTSKAQMQIVEAI